MGERGESSKGVTMKKEEGEEWKKVKKVKVVTSDGVTMEVEILIVKEMKTIETFINTSDTDIDSSIIFPLPNVTSHILNLIMELVSREYDQELVNRLSHDELKEMFLAADYLNMKTLLGCIAAAIANVIKNKSVEFVRNFFHISNDFTPEEEAEIRKANEWAFQGVDKD